MKYRYSALYYLNGLRVEDAEGDVKLIDDAEHQVSAVVTTDPDELFVVEDRADALSILVLNQIFRGQVTEGTFEERLQSSLDGVREQRRKRHGKGPYLVVSIDSETDRFKLPADAHETDDFVICYDAAPKDLIRQEHKEQIESVLAAVLVSTENLSGTLNLGHSVFFKQDDGKPIYSFSLGGSANLTVAKAYEQEEQQSAQTAYSSLAKQDDLARVRRLIVESLDSDSTSLKAFLSAWSAMEVLVNKAFPSHESKLFERNASLERVVDRVKGVMKDKYRLADKFAVVSGCLSPDECEADARAFETIKKTRDQLLHGRRVNENKLPIDDTRRLVRKYVGLLILT